jgi:E3 ubiquitin-protein ligase MYCBP2
MLYQELCNEAESLQEGGSEPGGGEPSVANEADTYCFEIMTLLLALSGSEAGQRQIASEPEVICDTCVVLQFGSPRSQRQAVQIIKRVVLDSMAPADADASLGSHSPAVAAHGFAGYMLACLASAFSLQLKRPGAKAAFPALDKGVASLEQLGGARVGWELAQDHLLKIVRTADGGAPGWGDAFRRVAAAALTAMPTLDPAAAAADPQVWLAVAGLASLSAESAEDLSSLALPRTLNFCGCECECVVMLHMLRVDFSLVHPLR